MTWRYGRVGGFLSGENGHLYGVTGAHVTNQSSDGWIYLEKSRGEFIKFGVILPSEITTQINKDIHIFKVEATFLDICTTYLDGNGKACDFSITNNEYSNSLYGKPIIMFRRQWSMFDHHDIQTEARFGKTASYDVHKKYDISDAYFLVEKIINNPFIEEGDSGNVIFLQTTNASAYLLGLVIGRFEHRSADDANLHSDFILCLHWKHGLNIIRNKFQLSFELSEQNSFLQKFLKTSGTKIWIKSKLSIMRIEDGDFHLHERLINLSDWLGTRILNKQGTFWTNDSYMLLLSQYVNSRQDLEAADYPTADHKCYLLAISGCDYIYYGKYGYAEKQIKRSVNLVAKTSIPYRLLSKIITYSTWLLLKQHKLTEMKKVIFYGLLFTLQFKDHDFRIHDSIGYLYFDLARYYIQKGKYQRALYAAYKSKQFFESFEKGGGISLEKQALTWALIARLNLNCGEYWERIHCKIFCEQEAIEHLEKLKQYIPSLPVVQKVCFYLANTDFYFRKNKIKEALVNAKICVDLSTEYTLQEELLKSRIKLIYLKKN